MRLIARLLRHFNSDPRFQYDLHLVGSVFWSINMALVVVVYLTMPHVWQAFSVLYLAVITFYGNFSSDYVGCSDAEASGHTAALRGIRQSAMHHGVLGRFLDRLSMDAHLQYRIHLFLTYTWLVQMFGAIVVYGLWPNFWHTAGALLYVVAVNVYTALATDYSALPGALAAYNAQLVRGGKSPWEDDATPGSAA